MVNEKFGTKLTTASIADLKYQLGVRSGIIAKIKKGEHRSPTTEWKKGHVPINKGTKGMFPNAGGATRFKKGNVPHNYRPVGTEVKTSDGYWKVKIADPNVWEMKHVLVWKREHGPVPEGMMVTFKDSDKLNCDIDNLMLITRGENIALTRHSYRSSDPDLTEAGLNVVRLEKAIKKKRKGRKHGSTKP